MEKESHFQALGDAPPSEVLEVEEEEEEREREQEKKEKEEKKEENKSESESEGKKERESKGEGEKEKKSEGEREEKREGGEEREKDEEEDNEEEKKKKEKPMTDAEIAIAKAKAEAASGKAKAPAAVPLFPLLKKPTIVVALVEPAGIVGDEGVKYPVLITVGSRFSHTLDLTFAGHRSVSEAIAAGHPTIIPPPFPEPRMFTNMVTNIEARSERGEELRKYYETIMSKSGYLKSEHVHKAFGITAEQRKMLRKAGRRMWKCMQQERQLAAIDKAKQILEEEEKQKQSLEAARLLSANFEKAQRYRSEGEDKLILEADVALRLVRPAITLLGPLMNVLDAEEQPWFSLRKLDSSRWNKWVEWCITNQKGLPLLVLKLDYSGTVLLGNQIHILRASLKDEDEDGVATGEATANADATYNPKQLYKEEKLLLNHVATVSCSSEKSTIQILDSQQYAPWQPAEDSKEPFTLLCEAKTTITGTAAERTLFNELHLFSTKENEVTHEQEKESPRASFFKIPGWRTTFDVTIFKGNDVTFYVGLAVAYSLLMEHDKTVTYEGASAVVL